MRRMAKIYRAGSGESPYPLLVTTKKEESFLVVVQIFSALE